MAAQRQVGGEEDSEVAKGDKIKEEIGWYKLIFGLLTGTYVPLVAWVVHPDSGTPDRLLWWALVLALCIAVLLLLVMWIIYRKIGELGDME